MHSWLMIASFGKERTLFRFPINIFINQKGRGGILLFLHYICRYIIINFYTFVNNLSGEINWLVHCATQMGRGTGNWKGVREREREGKGEGEKGKGKGKGKDERKGGGGEVKKEGGERREGGGRGEGMKKERWEGKGREGEGEEWERKGEGEEKETHKFTRKLCTVQGRFSVLYFDGKCF